MEAWASATGVPPEKVREQAEGLEEGLTRKTRAGGLQINVEGRGALAALFSLPGDSEPKTTCWEPEDVVIRGPLPPNTRILVGVTADGRRVRVRVRDNRLFIPGRTIQARRTEPEFPDIYEITSRHPRRRGDK